MDDALKAPIPHGGVAIEQSPMSHSLFFQEPWLHGGGDADWQSAVARIRGSGSHLQDCDARSAHLPTSALIVQSVERIPRLLFFPESERALVCRTAPHA